MPTLTNAGSGHSSGRMRRWPGLAPGAGSGSTSAAAASRIASTAWARTAATPAASISPSFIISAATRCTGSRSRQDASSSFVR